MRRFLTWLSDNIIEWLTVAGPASPNPLCDFNRLRYELRPGDILLVEGRTRVSDVIKLITQSPWTHSAIYIGRLYDITDASLRERIQHHYQGEPEDQLLVEANMGEGTVISNVKKYQHDHLRICRPAGLSLADARKVTHHCIRHLGYDYDVRQILDLARFFFPWSLMPRRWRSSLFQHNAGDPTRTVCSSMLAEAFSKVNFPILPFIDRSDDGAVRFFKRNPRLFTPRDFDYSPYFEIIKYPFLGINEIGLYRRLPWSDDELLYNDDQHHFIDEIQQTTVTTAGPNPQQDSKPNSDSISDSHSETDSKAKIHAVADWNDSRFDKPNTLGDKASGGRR